MLSGKNIFPGRLWNILLPYETRYYKTSDCSVILRCSFADGWVKVFLTGIAIQGSLFLILSKIEINFKRYNFAVISLWSSFQIIFMKLSFTNNESNWVKKLKNGDKKAFEAVFDYYKNYLFLFIRKALPSEEDPEGIVQEVFVSLWLNRENLDESKPLKPYLFTIAKNQVYDHLRKLYSKRKYLDSLLSGYASGADSAVNDAEYREFEHYLAEKINQLPARRKEIFKLSRLEGKSYREIAALLKISENTVDMQMRSANNTIAQAIKQYLAYLVFLFFHM